MPDAEVTLVGEPLRWDRRLAASHRAKQHLQSDAHFEAARACPRHVCAPRPTRGAHGRDTIEVQLVGSFDQLRVTVKHLGARHGIYHAPGAHRRCAGSLTCGNGGRQTSQAIRRALFEMEPIRIRYPSTTRTRHVGRVGHNLSASRHAHRARVGGPSGRCRGVANVPRPECVRRWACAPRRSSPGSRSGDAQPVFLAATWNRPRGRRRPHPQRTLAPVAAAGRAAATGAGTQPSGTVG